MNSDIKRLTRLSAILLQLQTKRLHTARELAEKYEVSVRTIYRDIRALEQSGVPIMLEEGKGYSLIEGYSVPPVMFTEAQANALVTAEQLVLQNKDASFVKAYAEAIEKIKAVLRYSQKDNADLLASRTLFSANQNRVRNSSNLTDLQYAITHYFVTCIAYTNALGEQSNRLIEPFALLSTDNWLLVAYCRMRKGFRYFRLDRMQKVEVLVETFEPHKMTLQEYFDTYY